MQGLYRKGVRVKAAVVEHAKGKLKVAIQEFISPTIIERLNRQAGILSPQSDDWRAIWTV